MSEFDFTGVKGVYKNCRGIWAAQWTDENGQRHTKYFNPKFYPNEAAAKLEAYKFKIQIQKEIERKGGVVRRRNGSARRNNLSNSLSSQSFETSNSLGRRARKNSKNTPQQSMMYMSYPYYAYATSPEQLNYMKNWGWQQMADAGASQNAVYYDAQRYSPVSQNAQVDDRYAHLAPYNVRSGDVYMQKPAPWEADTRFTVDGSMENYSDTMFNNSGFSQPENSWNAGYELNCAYYPQYYDEYAYLQN